jgi:metal-sulfur cluster biosynthetic enzyme
VVTEAEVRASLDGVIHPSFGISLIGLGMVRAVHIGSEHITVELVMNCPGCPASQATLNEAQRAVQALAPGIAVQLTLLPAVWRAPWDAMFGS